MILKRVPKGRVAERYDVAILGAGIIGLAHAYWCSQQGLRVLVIEAKESPQESSVRNFGFVTVSGQISGVYHELALEAAQMWQGIAAEAGIPVYQQGSLVVAQRAESKKVLEEYAASSDGAGCQLLSKEETLQRFPEVSAQNFGALYSPHEIRIDPLEASARLREWLAEKVDFLYSTEVLRVEPQFVHLCRGEIAANQIICAPGCRLPILFPEIAEDIGFTQTKLHMLEVQPKRSLKLPASLMSDCSMVFYRGFADLPACAALKEAVFAEYPEVEKHLVNTIIVQQGNGNLVIGDTHEYGKDPDPFYYMEAEEAVLTQIKLMLGENEFVPVRRWVGFYPWAAKELTTFRQVARGVHVATVNRGKGMSICWAWAQRNLNMLLSNAA